MPGSRYVYVTFVVILYMCMPGSRYVYVTFVVIYVKYITYTKVRRSLMLWP